MPHCATKVYLPLAVRCRAFGLVKRGEMNLEHVRDGLVLAQPRRVVERAGEQRLFDRAIGVFLNRELDGVTLRLRQTICAIWNSG